MTARRVALLLLLMSLLAACAGGSGDTAGSTPRSSGGSESAATPAPDGADAHTDAHADDPPQTQVKARPLRAGERRMTLAMPAAYRPSAPTGVGTDDYRCFLLDPDLAEDSYLTGTDVRPGNPGVVHHVILFRVPAEQVAEAERRDAAVPGEGWTCFGGTGLSGNLGSLDDAPWLGAWAPGGGESVTRKGYGVQLDRGSRIIMQVHYNLLAGSSPDVSAARLRLAPASARLTPLHTFLMPAPVELPCRPDHDESPLCDRATAVADVKARFGTAGGTADLLYFLCGGRPVAGEVTSCTRRVQEPLTVLGTAGHMHLLGRSITIETNPDTPEARTVLDIPVWDFDNQGARPVTPVRLDAGDTVRVTCRHVQWLRDELPSFAGQDERYVVWGEGTTDEMCLGMLQVAAG